MQELLVLSNPSRRRRRKAKRASSRRRGARKMSALQKKYFGGGRRKHRSAPAVLANPTKRRGRRRSTRAITRRRSRGGSRSGGILGKVLKGGTGSLGKPLSMIGPALTGAVGAIAVHAVAARLPLPAMLLVGKTRYLTQGALAIGLGMAASKVGVGSATAAKMAEGSLTVTITELLKEIAMENGVNLGGMGVYFPGVQATMPSASGNPAQLGRIGAYVSGPGSVTSIRPRMGNINSFKF